MKQFTFAQKWFKKIEALKPVFLKIAQKSGTPVYVFDPNEVRANIVSFKNAFKDAGVDANIFYAAKSNYYPPLLQTVVKSGEGIDVSSGRELKLALKAKARRIIYTGPAKSEKDFELILKNISKITVNLESVRELKLFDSMCSKKRVRAKCGVRIFTQSQAGWTKFGIPLSELRSFSDEAAKCGNINFCGIHFHISFNKDPENYVNTIIELADYMKANFSGSENLRFEYVDIGGGFYPQSFEALYPWNPEQHTYYPNEKEILDKIISDSFQPRYLPLKVDSIEKFAKDITAAFKNKILKIMPNAALYCEPGRYISHSSMHILLRIMDIKRGKIGITDGGANMIGWEKYQYCDYVPTFNLSQFTQKREIPFMLYGSLCTPEDIWSYYLYTASDPKEGDIVLVPFQGAYTYTLAQEFIKEIPPVLDLKR